MCCCCSAIILQCSSVTAAAAAAVVSVCVCMLVPLLFALRLLLLLLFGFRWCATAPLVYVCMRACVMYLWTCMLCIHSFDWSFRKRVVDKRDFNFVWYSLNLWALHCVSVLRRWFVLRSQSISVTLSFPSTWFRSYAVCSALISPYLMCVLIFWLCVTVVAWIYLNRTDLFSVFVHFVVTGLFVWLGFCSDAQNNKNAY